MIDVYLQDSSETSYVLETGGGLTHDFYCE